MHAAVIRTYGDESVFEIQDNLTPPEPKSNQVLVKISAIIEFSLYLFLDNRKPTSSHVITI